ncbi:GNAT family N-acetyltransferase [Variovorax sp. J22R133]|uniref:GNAT family N-acetyltransferase n=1 Tax=Variovorax brevis TaxID=3053503 RepID=UPI002578B3A9|nr:GNAT family N-acetyltransferase [Variovorax sp. J22R133]MDM0110926.1 GNAT family N-acetyltransferase [Variovorax sp. J22R133]
MNQTAAAPDSTISYPRTVLCEGKPIELDLLRAGDEAELLAFAQGLPEHDLLFIDRDISQPRVIRAWIRESVELGRLPSLMARVAGGLVGCSTLYCNELSWSSHVGEIRILVARPVRGLGLGRLLIQACFAQALELGLEKLVARMTTDQRSAIAIFESLGFRAEALLAEQVRDRSGRKHDVVLLSHDVEAVGARLSALGADEIGKS